MNENLIDPRKCEHGKFKQACKECGGSAVCEHGKFKRICKECNGSAYCTHNKNKIYCKDCSPKSYCIHDKFRKTCIECNGSDTCEHNKLKYLCKECGGKGICIHNRQKLSCKDCGNGSSICSHGKNKQICKDCNGSKICIHKKFKILCQECSPQSFCKHNKNKYNCQECSPQSFCKHNKNKYNCKECSPQYLCEHNKNKYICKDCCGSSLCIHKKIKSLCKICDGAKLCKSEWCETTGNAKYNNYCLFCYINLFPDQEITRNYKTKEKDVVDRIKNIFPDFSWVHDKKIQDGCSRRRPDLLLDIGTHIIIIEIDENKHNDYNCICEHKRLMELSQDLQHRPIIFIRFNPDEYTNDKGELVKSCWKLNKLGIMQISKSKILEWEERIECLIIQIDYWINHSTEKTIEIIELFY